jgi:hypothetical protein
MALISAKQVSENSGQTPFWDTYTPNWPLKDPIDRGHQYFISHEIFRGFPGSLILIHLQVYY